jgi:hypothetical protein
MLSLLLPRPCRNVKRSGVVSDSDRILTTVGVMTLVLVVTLPWVWLLLCLRLICRRRFSFFLPLLRRRNDLVVRAAMKTAMPATCSAVHTLLNSKKERNSVVALRAVLVIDMVKAPKFLVMAALVLLPKNPMVLNSTMTTILPTTDHER